MDKAFLEALVKLKSKDRTIYEPTTRLFPKPDDDDEAEEGGEEEGEEGEGAGASGRGDKPVYLRDMLYQQVRRRVVGVARLAGACPTACMPRQPLERPQSGAWHGEAGC